MSRRVLTSRGWPAALSLLLAFPAAAQSFRVQCPTSTITHPSAPSSEPAYGGATVFKCSVTGGCAGSGVSNAGSSDAGYLVPATGVNGAIKCQQVSGGDGYSTMADGTQTYMFSFGPLSGLADIAAGRPGTEFAGTFNGAWPGASSGSPLLPGDPATTVDAGGAFGWNGAVGLTPNVPYTLNVFAVSESAGTVTVVLNASSPFALNDSVVVSGVDAAVGSPAGTYDGTWTVSAVNVSNAYFSPDFAFQYSTGTTTTNAGTNTITGATASSVPRFDGHVDPRQIMDVGVMNGNIPAPLLAIDEDDEFFLTLTNVGMIMRPDLFEQHTIHFHGYPNASSFFDGVPDASVAINIGGSFTYYYLAPDAGTYFWHCHITPPEHLQMGMVGQLYVRPRQNRWAGSLYGGLQAQQADLRTACPSSSQATGAPATDVLCSNPLPALATSASNDGSKKYAYNDGDGSTYYDVEYPLQIHGFDPNFHFVGMTFNPEGFADMKDKYFLLNGRSYPDTVTPAAMQTPAADGVRHFSQPLSAIVSIPAGERALIRISDLDVSEYQTLASLGVQMQVIGYNAKLLRDQAGNNLYYTTNSITLGGGESLDVILDTCTQRTVTGDPSSPCAAGAALPKGTYYLYTPNLDHLSNDAENFGGLMTEVRVN